MYSHAPATSNKSFLFNILKEFIGHQPRLAPRLLSGVGIKGSKISTLNIETKDRAMIIVNIRMEVLAGKRKEFLRAIEGIVDITRKAKGCVSQRIWQNIGDENQFEVSEVWKSQEELDAHWRSDIFGALLGTEHLLRVSPQIFTNVVSHTAGMEAVAAARQKSPL